MKFIWCNKRFIYPLAALLLGTILGYYTTSKYESAQIPKKLLNTRVNLEGRILSQPIYKNTGVTFKVAVKSINSHIVQNNLPIVNIYSKKKFIANVNDTWRFIGKIKPIRSFFNPGSFSVENYAYAQNISAQAFVTDYVLLQPGHLNYVEYLRNKVYKQLLASSSLENKYSILMALIIGIKDHITAEDQEIFKQLGIVHLLVISGLHISCIVIAIHKITSLALRYMFVVSQLGNCLAFWVTKYIAKSTMFYTQSSNYYHRLNRFVRNGTQYFSMLPVVFSICMSCLYAYLAGFNIATQRAITMLLVAYVPHMIRRPIKISDRYAFSLLIVLFCEPRAVLNLGFYLSFAAVFILLYALNGFSMQNAWIKTSQAWVITIGLVPIQAITGLTDISLVSPIANFIAIPIVAMLIVPISLLGILVLPISSTICIFLWAIANKILIYLLFILKIIPNFNINVMQQPLIMFPIIAIVVLWLLTPFLPGKFLGFISLLAIFSKSPTIIPYGEAKVTMLDVGQGLSILIQTEKHNILYDTGPKFGIHDAGDLVIVPFFKFIGLRQLDIIFLSHVDNDHIGGLKSVLQKYKPQYIVSSEQEKFLFPIYKCDAGKSMNIDGVEFFMLHPDNLLYNEVNNSSCVLKVTTKQHSMLIPGDIDASIEKQLIEKYSNKLKADILVVPHHGSKKSSSVVFLQAVAPKIALTSVGFMNQYKHPHMETIKRYQDFGIRFLNTIDDGAITLFLGKHLIIDSYRKQQAFSK